MRLLGVLSASTALLALLGPSLVGAAKKPTVNMKVFDHLPKSYFYFEDSPVILSTEQEKGTVWRSENDGEKWDPIDSIPGDKVYDIFLHPFDNSRAFVLCKGTTHYVTSDKGKSWKKFETEWVPTIQRNPLSFHSKEKGHILYTGAYCEQDLVWKSWFCIEKTWYTKDGFDSSPTELLKENTHGCMFARSTTEFDKGSENKILCIVDGAKAGLERRILLVSKDFFNSRQEPDLDGSKKIEGLTGLASVKKYIVAAVKSAGTDEMALFVSDDGDKWDRAEFPSDHGGLKQDGYTILESTTYGIQVDVLTTTDKNAMGSLFTSNSNGTYFTRNIDHTNRNGYGNVDFEQVAGIDGIVLVNIVDNAEELLKGHGNQNIEKKIKSKISFDGGRSFKDMKAGDDTLHVHSVTEARNGGRVFSSPAPGILMAVGNTGKFLGKYSDAETYVSDDAGLTWKKTDLKGPHLYEFGDSGSILVAVAGEGRADKLHYSLNHGKNWDSVDLEAETRVLALTTVPDSTSKKFTMIAQSKDAKGYIFSINFDGVLDRKCKKDDDKDKSDFEKWYSRYGDDGKPSCLMGHKEFYWRRKKDAECFVEAEYKDPKPEKEDCPCTDEDYECDFEFADKEKKGECVLVGRLPDPSGSCQRTGDKFKGSSGYRLIPGNTCVRDKGVKKDEPIERDCKDGNKKGSNPPASGKIKSILKTHDAGGFYEYYYLERKASSEGDDETIIARTDKNRILITHDQGGTWEEPKIFNDVEVTAIYPHPYFNDIVFFLTPSKKFILTINRGKNFKEGEGPAPPTNRDDIALSLRFHPTNTDFMIWIADRDCEDLTSKQCHAAAWYTKSRDTGWVLMQRYVRNCAWIHSNALERTPDKLVYCEKYTRDERPTDSNPVKLISSEDLFGETQTRFEKIMGFATMEEFIVVAEVKDESSLKLDASIDGKIFAEAKFPHNLQVDKQQAYTVLDSVTHAVFLHVTVNPMRGSEYGTLVKSNSNGTSYVLSLSGVNRNEVGYVDFEKMQGLEGVAIVNIVKNVDEVNKGGKKKLKTKITHNDGGDWQFLSAPETDFDGKDYDCDRKDLDNCSLNLHGYTERKDPRDTFSSGSAVGLMVGVGNVGESLTSKREGNTYITRDGGITWFEIRKGSYMWEYGDQGSIIVIVDEVNPTNSIYYTLDEGRSWNEYNFGDKVKVNDITTIPSDTSRKFLLWGINGKEKAVTVQIDFTGLTDKQCELPKPDSEQDGDFDLWEPKHPEFDKEHRCLFGHRVKYYRKKPDRNCFVGSKVHAPVESGKCGCKSHDYECDYNYERGTDGGCHLIHGLPKPDHKAMCAADKSLKEYWEPTGYRRIPLSQCEGGDERDKIKPLPCPGYEEEFEKKHGVSGWVIFLGVIFAFGAAGGVGLCVWNKWNGKFGAIRLGEDAGSRGQSPFVRYPIIAISALVAVTMAIPAVVQAIVGWVASKLSRPKRYTTRGSFARGNYAVVDNDEGELLGSDDEEN